MRHIVLMILIAVVIISFSACGAEGQPNTPMDEDVAAATAMLEEAVERRETILTSKA